MTIPERPVWFSEAEVTRLLDPALLVERLAAAFLEAAAGGVTEPRPLRIDALEHAANYVAFPCYRPSAGIATVKVLSGALRNPGLGLPMIDAIVAVMDAVTGRIVAVMDGRRITALRTAATTALALRAFGLAPGASLGLVGTGVQMFAHAEAVCAVADIGRILVASSGGDADRAAAAAETVAALTGRPAGAVSVREAAGADAVVLTTLSPVPLVTAEDLAADARVASVGPFLPGRTELDPAVVAGASLVVSDLPSRLQDHWRPAADRLGANFDAVVGLPDLLAPRPPAAPGHRVFLSDGRGLEDLVAASLVIERAAAAGVEGLRLP